MTEGGISVGTRVRYPRTGTVGTVVRIEKEGRSQFAELDSTHLLYRIDYLVPVDVSLEKSRSVERDFRKEIEEAREFASGSGFQDSLKNIDQSCEGGG
ncbi:MAG: DUF2098 domain-containing protein [Methanoregulaceae archaeon]|nr:DUF2098 domain-containing protein [Methanoregulaceae archaeon]